MSSNTTVDSTALKLLAPVGIFRWADTGWEASIQRRLEKRRKVYLDSTHGGEQGALKKAVAWRARQEREMPAAWGTGSMPDPVGTLVLYRTLQPVYDEQWYVTGYVDVMICRLKVASSSRNGSSKRHGWIETSRSVDRHGTIEAERLLLDWAALRVPKDAKRCKPRKPRGQTQEQREKDLAKHDRKKQRAHAKAAA